MTLCQYINRLGNGRPGNAGLRCADPSMPDSEATWVYHITPINPCCGTPSPFAKRFVCDECLRVRFAAGRVMCRACGERRGPFENIIQIRRL